MSDDSNDKSPQDAFRTGVKATVNAVNRGLASMEQASNSIITPAASTWATVSSQATSTYQRRHEFAPEIIGGSALLGGGIAALRRGRVVGVLGAAIAGSTAYAVVYDEINFDQIPEMIFGKKE